MQNYKQDMIGVIFNLSTNDKYIYHFNKITQMGNQQSSQYRTSIQRRSRYRTVDNSGGNTKNNINISRRFDNSYEDGSIFVTPPINKSVITYKYDQNNDEDEQSQRYGSAKKNYQSIDVNQYRERERAQSTKAQRTQKDRVLQSLSKKNEQLRKQLKQISEDLSQKLKRKKLVPKKKVNGQDDDKSEYDVKVADKQIMGLKRELENGYKQIQMYKKIIMNLKSKEGGITIDHRVNVLQNQIAVKNQQIEKLLKKKMGIEKVKNKQGEHISQQINEDLVKDINTLKKQTELLRKKLFSMAQKDREKQKQYKQQQAYYCDLQKLWSQVNDTYFPDLKNKLKKDQPKTATSDPEVNPQQFYQIAEEARKLRIKHQQYNRKIEILLLARNKRVEEQNDLKDQVVYKQRIIQALKIKVGTLQQLLKPKRNKSLFGYDSQNQGSEAQSDFHDNQSEIQRQLEQQLKQDQFDIKHLIANIPKPVRKRPQELSNGYSSGGSSQGDRRRGGGLIVTSQKAQPKRWGATTTRSEQRGKHFKGQLAFEDRAQFDGDVHPIIVGMNVWVNRNNAILGIQAIYLSNNEYRYGVMSSTSIEGLIKRFDLKAPDYVKNLSFTMSSEGYIQSITFYSKLGVINKLGNKRSADENINFGLASSQRPFMLFGASSLFESEPRLNFLGIEICSQ